MKLLDLIYRFLRENIEDQVVLLSDTIHIAHRHQTICKVTVVDDSIVVTACGCNTQYVLEGLPLYHPNYFDNLCSRLESCGCMLKQNLHSFPTAIADDRTIKKLLSDC